MKKTITLSTLTLLLSSNAVLYAQIGDGSDDVNFSTYNNFDFIAGSKILSFDDFSTGLSKWKVIEFDHSDEFEAPNIKKLYNDGTDWFKTPRKGIFYPLQLNTLPNNFTLEFDMIVDMAKMSEMEGGLNVVLASNKINKDEFSIHFDENPQIQLDIHPSQEVLSLIATKEAGNDDRTLFRKEIKNGWSIGKRHHVSITRKGTQITLYLNEKKFIDLPNGLPINTPYTLLFSTNLWGDGIYITNFKVAEIVEKTALSKENKYVTNAIYFNVNSDAIKPESWSALNQAANAIQSTKGKILIVGHTDGDGNESDNLTLSKKRAEAVKANLIKNFGIESNRLTTDGKGESQPIDSNSTLEGKANNRRVEFIVSE